jgi:hypothetical protein
MLVVNKGVHAYANHERNERENHNPHCSGIVSRESKVRSSGADHKTVEESEEEEEER